MNSKTRRFANVLFIVFALALAVVTTGCSKLGFGGGSNEQAPEYATKAYVDNLATELRGVDAETNKTLEAHGKRIAKVEKDVKQIRSTLDTLKKQVGSRPRLAYSQIRAMLQNERLTVEQVVAFREMVITSGLMDDGVAEDLAKAHARAVELSKTTDGAYQAAVAAQTEVEVTTCDATVLGVDLSNGCNNNDDDK